ncbi:hypothetical protein [Telmatospirillum sp.]|uniref:hypothetical protein n=1 Tax=Telmatospirillum sp. TaxID=2079197 RepID=UPI00284E718A|nr:hypothetical protein [Telmatospirillum sp.]MDR3439280.1 hypothetical protein [Telmatospirillum sp.]
MHRALAVALVLLCGGILAPDGRGAVAADAASVPSRLALGIDRLTLSAEPRAVKKTTLRHIRDLGLIWLRDGPTSGSSRAVANFVEEVGIAKQYQLKVLAIIMPMDEDYDVALPVNRCGWHEKRLSQINLVKYAQRLRTVLGAVKAAGLSVDAFEFGSEADQYCYDADVPHGHAGAASPAEIKTWLTGYGRFLQTGAAIVHDPTLFPDAKIITFGMAHSGDSHADDSFPDPARYVAMLRNVDGVNYLKGVDGYGTHLYPSPNDIENSLRRTLGEDVSALGRDKPLWITEWGFLEIRAFPNRSGQTLPQCLRSFLDVLDDLHRDIPIGPAMYFRYDVWLSDSDGNPLPQAGALSAYATR